MSEQLEANSFVNRVCNVLHTYTLMYISILILD